MDSSLVRQEVEDEVEGLEEGEEKVCNINNLFLQTVYEGVGDLGSIWGSASPQKILYLKISER